MAEVVLGTDKTSDCLGLEHVIVSVVCARIYVCGYGEKKDNNDCEETSSCPPLQEVLIGHDERQGRTERAERSFDKSRLLNIYEEEADPRACAPS